MSAAGWELQKSVYGALIADAGLLGLLGAPRVYDDVPMDAAYPYVTIGETAIRDWSTGTEEGGEHILTLHVWSRGAGRKEAQVIMDAVRAALHGAPLAVSGHLLINFRHELSEARRETDGETYHGLVRFRAVTEPSP